MSITNPLIYAFLFFRDFIANVPLFLRQFFFVIFALYAFGFLFRVVKVD